VRTLLWVGSRQWEDVDAVCYAIEGFPWPFRSLVGDSGEFDFIVWELLAAFHLPRLQFKSHGNERKRDVLMLTWLQLLDPGGFVVAGLNGPAKSNLTWLTDRAERLAYDVWRINVGVS
jgi:hypothetical protein